MGNKPLTRHNGTLCSKFVSEKLPLVIKHNLMFSERKQQADLEHQDSLFEFVKGVLEEVDQLDSELQNGRSGLHD